MTDKYRERNMIAQVGIERTTAASDNLADVLDTLNLLNGRRKSFPE
jgi:hypothetical protein